MAPFRLVMMFMAWPGIRQSSPRRDAAARAAVAQLRDAALGEIFDTTQGEVQQTALVQLQDSAAFTPQRCLVAIKNFRFTHPTLPGAMIAMISRVDWQSSQELLSILIKLAIDAPNREARAVALAELGKGQNLPAVPVLCDQLARGGYSFFLSALNQILAAQDSFPAEMMKRACDPRFFGAVREVAQRNDQDEVTLAARELLSRLAQENLTEESVAAPPAQAARTAAAARPGALRSSLAGVMERLGPSSKQLDLP